MPEESKLADKLENSQKFTEDEIKKIKEVQDEYFRIQNTFGQLSISEIRLAEQEALLQKNVEQVREAFVKVQVKEKELLDELTKKYGEGTLDPTSGQFTPNK